MAIVGVGIWQGLKELGYISDLTTCAWFLRPSPCSSLSGYLQRTLLAGDRRGELHGAQIKSPLQLVFLGS